MAGQRIRGINTFHAEVHLQRPAYMTISFGYGALLVHQKEEFHEPVNYKRQDRYSGYIPRRLPGYAKQHAGCAGLEEFRKLHESIFADMYRILKPSGSICWQVGSHVAKGEVMPLDIEIYNLFTELGSRHAPSLVCRGRIIWTFGHGLHCRHRFSGRHETILWFTKGDIRGDVDGLPPYDVWDIPNVKGNHVEKTAHPCQYPIALPKRLVHALTAESDLVVDPFLGAGTTGAAAVLEGRRFAGAEMQEDYIKTAEERIRQAAAGTLRYRADVPVIAPDPRTAQARRPEGW